MKTEKKFKKLAQFPGGSEFAGLLSLINTGIVPFKSLFPIIQTKYYSMLENKVNNR